MVGFQGIVFLPTSDPSRLSPSERDSCNRRAHTVHPLAAARRSLARKAMRHRAPSETPWFFLDAVSAPIAGSV